MKVQMVKDSSEIIINKMKVVNQKNNSLILKTLELKRKNTSVRDKRIRIYQVFMQLYRN